MLKAAIAKLSYWRRALHARMALVLILSLVVAGLQGHVTYEHVVAPDAQTTEVLEDHGHSHDELDGGASYGGHDHSHQFSLMTNLVEVVLPMLRDVAHASPQQSIKGIHVFDIDKPPKQAAII